MKDKIEDLRRHLFAQLEKISDCEERDLDTEIKRAAAMIQISENIIDSARAETEFLDVSGGNGSGFIGSSAENNNQQKKLDKPYEFNREEY